MEIRMKKIATRQLGSTGLEVSTLGLGTVKFGRNQNVKNKIADGFPLPSDSEIIEILDLAIEVGINLLDTAPAYDLSEKRLGELLGDRRESFNLFTKTGEEFDGKSSTYNFSSEHTEKSVSRSLKRLKTDRLEGVLVHCSGNDLEIIENSPVLETLAGLKEKGDILSYGVSTMSLEGGLKAVELCDLVMVSYNSSYQAELPVIEKAQETSKGVFIKKALHQGHLDSSAVTPIQHVLQVPGISSIIFGTTSPTHLAENAHAAIDFSSKN